MKKNIFFFLTAIVLVTVITFSWFSEGKIISNNSEENLNIFHAQKTSERYAGLWNQSGTGAKIAFNRPNLTTFVALGFFEDKKFPVFLTQAVFLGTLIFVGIVSAYLLIYYGLKIDYLSSVVGSFFYLLNIFSMTQIWKRFVYNHIFTWAYFPLFIFLWIRWMETGRLSWLLTFVLSSLLFTHAFGNPVFLATFWIPALIFVLNALRVEIKNKRSVANILICSTVGFILWSTVNFWWLYPSLTLGSSWTAQTGQTWQSDFNSLLGVSKYFTLSDVLLLRQSWYLDPSNDWGNFYHNPFIFLINIGVLLIMLYGMLKSKGLKYRKFFLILAMVGLFISKGTNFPFGYSFFAFLFSNFPLASALRNSYEKFGLVWLLPYTIFFTYGFYYLFSRFKARLRYLIEGLVIILSLVLLVLPIWNGEIFPQKHRLTVPSYYIEANNYLNGIKSSRLFTIPYMLETEKQIYSWGYVGEDPTDNLFDSVQVAKPRFSYFNRLYELFPNLISDSRFPRILGLIGVDNVILYKNIIYPKVDYPTTTNYLNRWEGINSVKDIGDLQIYSLNQELVKQRIFSASDINIVKTPREAVEKILDDDINSDNSVFVLEKEVPNMIPDLLVQPKMTFRKISNEYYIVHISQSDGPFVLVLNDTFDRLWVGRINDEVINNHFMVNGFANGWLINKTGTYDIDIVFKFWPWE